MRKIILSISIIILSSLLWTFIFAGKFYIEPRETTVSVNCPFEVKIMIDTQKQPITAADMSLRYDDVIFEVKWFIPSDMFSIYRWLKKDYNSLRITALQYPGFIKEENEFGTLILEAKQVKQTTRLQFEVDGFSSTSTLDTSLAFKWEDYLTEVGNALIHIEEWECNFNFEQWLSWFVEYDTELTYQEFEEKRVEEIDKQYGEYKINQKDNWKIQYEFNYLFFVFMSLMILLIIIIRYRKKKQ